MNRTIKAGAVVDAHSKPIGFLTDRDICMAASAGGKPRQELPVAGRDAFASMKRIGGGTKPGREGGLASGGKCFAARGRDRARGRASQLAMAYARALGRIHVRSRIPEEAMHRRGGGPTDSLARDALDGDGGERAAGAAGRP